MDRSTLSSGSRTNGRSPEVSSTAFRTQPPEFTTSAFDGYGLRCQLPARPAPYASNPVLVHRLVRLFRASFRPSVAGTPLRFAMTSPPSGCQGDFHPRAVEHARHTTKRAGQHQAGPLKPTTEDLNRLTFCRRGRRCYGRRHRSCAKRRRHRHSCARRRRSWSWERNSAAWQPERSSVASWPAPSNAASWPARCCVVAWPERYSVAGWPERYSAAA